MLPEGVKKVHLSEELLFKPLTKAIHVLVIHYGALLFI